MVQTEPKASPPPGVEGTLSLCNPRACTTWLASIPVLVLRKTKRPLPRGASERYWFHAAGFNMIG